MNPRGVDLEITEQRKPDQPLSGDTGSTVVVPNQCVINGLPVLIPSGVPIDIEASDDNVVTARLTVMVHRLRIHPEHEPPADDTWPPIWQQMVDDLPDNFTGHLWPAPELLTFKGIAATTATAHGRHAGDYFRRRPAYTLAEFTELRDLAWKQETPTDGPT